MKLAFNGYLYESLNRQLIFYHRTNYINNISSIGTKGILPELNSSALYGKGLYGTTSLESQFGLVNHNSKKDMEFRYGKYITKLRTVTDGLLIMNPRLDPDITVGSIWETLISKIPEESIDFYFLLEFCSSFIEDKALKYKIYGINNNDEGIDFLKDSINSHKNDKIIDLTKGENGKTDKLVGINSFVIWLNKNKLLNNFIGFCLYGSNDGDVIVLHRGAVVTPIAYSNANPASIENITWKHVAKKVDKITKSLIHSTINSQGDNTATFQNMIDAYNNMDFERYKELANEHPEYLDKLYNSRSWFAESAIDGEIEYDSKIIDFLNSKGKLDSDLVTSTLNNPYYDIPIEMFNKIINLQKDGKYLTDFKHLDISSELFDKLLNNTEIINIILDRGCPLIVYHNPPYAIRVFIAREMYSELNKVLANNGPNIEQLNEVVSSIINPNEKIKLEDLPILKTEPFKQNIANIFKTIKTEYAASDIVHIYNKIVVAASINPDVFSSEQYKELVLKLVKETYPSKSLEYMKEIINACKSSIENEISDSTLYSKMNPKLKYLFSEKYGNNFRIKYNGVLCTPLVYALITNDWQTIDLLMENPNIDINAICGNKMNALGVTLINAEVDEDKKDFLNLLLSNTKVIKKVYMDQFHKLEKYQVLAKKYNIEIA